MFVNLKNFVTYTHAQTKQKLKIENQKGPFSERRTVTGQEQTIECTHSSSIYCVYTSTIAISHGTHVHIKWVNVEFIVSFCIIRKIRCWSRLKRCDFIWPGDEKRVEMNENLSWHRINIFFAFVLFTLRWSIVFAKNKGTEKREKKCRALGVHRKPRTE